MTTAMRTAHDSEWLCWKAERLASESPLGLWRRHGTGSAWEFQCPSLRQLTRLDRLGAPGESDAESSAHELKSQIAAWAVAAAAGNVPEGWEPPSSAELETWLSSTRLDVRAGTRVARGQIEAQDGRLRLAFDELARLPAEAPASQNGQAGQADQADQADQAGRASQDGRADWLRALCADTQSSWHLVRFSLLDGCVRAEVDLTGVPARYAPALVQRSREVLLISVRRALPALRLVADPRTRSRILDSPTPPAGPTSGHA